MSTSPAVLFNPEVCVPLGAMADAKIRLNIPEKADDACGKELRECSWQRVWRRRFCVFNTGDEKETCDYANVIMDGTRRVPGVGSFAPR
jgi:hypothetical protein